MCAQVHEDQKDENKKENEAKSPENSMDDEVEWEEGDELAAQDDNFQDDSGFKVKSENFEVASVGIKCPFCDHTLGSKSAVHDHKVGVHSWGKFCCPHGDFEGQFATDLIDHMKQVQHPEDSEVVCPRCGDEFFMNHIASHYRDCARDRSKAKKRKVRENIESRAKV